MIRDISGSQKSIDEESNVIYNYLFDCASNEPPQTVIRKFNSLFIQGKSENREVSQALKKIVFSIANPQKFNQIFSHCFYIVINYWIATPESLFYASELLDILEIISKSSSYDRLRKQLIKLIIDYQKSPEYLKLKGLITIIQEQKNNSRNNILFIKSEESDEISDSKGYESEIINNYLYRYTFLYQYFTPQNSELNQLNEFVISLQDNHSKDFEIKLSRHIIYRFRLKQVAKMKLLSKGAGKVISKVDNPSMLSERAFRVALKQYIGKIDAKQTLLERSQKFVTDNKIRNSYQVFKQDLYIFLTKDIKARNSNYNFEQKLEKKLATIFPQSNQKPLNNTHILQTCRQLVSFLITESNYSNNSLEFASLVANLGTAQVMKILMKIALICPESKPDLEKKLSSIVNHYQLHKVKDAPWVVKT
ncbi:MAG: hypothetical protein ACFCAD_25155 [Pleurocapsa sp.]